MKKILIIDDDKVNLTVIKKFLENDFEVMGITESILALNTYKSFQPDIIITDIDMPVIDGLELSKKIRDIDKNVKIIVLTGHEKMDYILSAVELNLTKYLIKPVSSETINDAVLKAIDEINNYEVINKRKLLISKNIYWDYEKKILFKDNQEIKLTKKELQLIDLLTTNPNIAKKYDEIGVNIWEDKYYYDDIKGSLKTLIHGLKNKLDEKVIVNVSGVGYKLETLT